MTDGSLDRPASAGRNPLGDMLRFLVPSGIGILLFLTPFTFDGKQTILIGIVMDAMHTITGVAAVPLVVAFVWISLIGNIYYLMVRPPWTRDDPRFLVRTLFTVCHTNTVWFALQLFGALIGLMVLTGIGPEILRGDDTGGGVYRDLGPATLFVTIACIAMPFLTDYGLMDMVGKLAERPFAWLFRLPGRAALDAVASFVGSNTVGILLTVKQYESGHYSGREAVSVALNFSVVSIAFSLVVASVARIDTYFFLWYLTVVAASLFCALVLVRIPPLSRKPAGYYKGRAEEAVPEKDDRSVWRGAFDAALARARQAPTTREFLESGWLMGLGVTCNVIGPSMAIATLGTIFVFQTPVFDMLSLPIRAFLDLFAVPETNILAPGFLAGIMDMFMPVLIAERAESETVRFVLAGLGVTQLIYFGESGIVLLRSTLPLSLMDLLVVFVLRTLLSLPILLIGARLIL